MHGTRAKHCRCHNRTMSVLSAVLSGLEGMRTSAACGAVLEAVGAIALDVACDALLWATCYAMVTGATCETALLATWDSAFVAPCATCSAPVAAATRLKRMLKVFEGMVACT